MGGCNCKKNKPMNNLRSPDHIAEAKKTYNEVIVGKTEYSELDKVIIQQTYSQLYPSSSATPSTEEAINQIKTAINIYDVKYRR